MNRSRKSHPVLILVAGLTGFVIGGCGPQAANHGTTSNAPHSAPSMWSEATHARVATLRGGESLWPNPFASTVWGGVQSKRADKLPPRFREATTTVASEHFGAGDLEIGFYTQSEGKADSSSQAPLMVFLPGLFSGTKGSGPTRALYFFATRGYHVAVIPSPWSPGYIRKEPDHRPGDLLDEARAVRDVIGRVQKRLGSKATKTHLAGESYGGFLASVAVAQDAKSTTPLIDGRTTIIGPPRNMDRAITALDRSIEETAAAYQDECSGWTTKLAVAKDYGQAASQTDLAPRSRDCARPLFAHYGFQESLRDTARAVDSVFELDILSESIFRTDPLLKTLDFRGFVETFTPMNESLLQNEDFVDLTHWLREAEAAGYSRFRVITSGDDPLNPSRAWADETRLPLSERRLIQLPWGGHLGFESLPWFSGFLDRAFAPRQEGFKPFHSVKNDVYGLE